MLTQMSQETRNTKKDFYILLGVCILLKYISQHTVSASCIWVKLRHPIFCDLPEVRPRLSETGAVWALNPEP